MNQICREAWEERRRRLSKYIKRLETGVGRLGRASKFFLKNWERERGPEEGGSAGWKIY